MNTENLLSSFLRDKPASLIFSPNRIGLRVFHVCHSFMKYGHEVVQDFRELKNFEQKSCMHNFAKKDDSDYIARRHDFSCEISAHIPSNQPSRWTITKRT